MKMRRIIKPALFLLALAGSVVLAYRFGVSTGKQSCEFTVDKEMCERVLSYDDEQSSYAQDIPECDFNGCPEYKAIDTDGDNQYESVVYRRIAMTKGAGEVWIIDEGKVVFRVGGAQFSYEENEDMPGITVSYVKEFDETGLNPKTWVTEKWIYIGGEYVLADDYEGFCEEHIDLESEDGTIEVFEGAPKYPDFSFDQDASRFRTVISEAVDSGANYAGHYTIASWGCGTDCFGYAVIDLLSGEVVTFSPANESYNISGLDINGSYMILNPVSAGQDKKYYKLSEYRNYSDEIVSIFNLVCTEISTQDMYGSPE